VAAAAACAFSADLPCEENMLKINAISAGIEILLKYSKGFALNQQDTYSTRIPYHQQ
tara:strand:+ start:974 stop:1144 length:171 start_codon:yes stop_codon:yes gene_type:complete